MAPLALGMMRLPAGKGAGQSPALDDVKRPHPPAIEAAMRSGFDFHHQQTWCWAIRFDHHQIDFPIAAGPTRIKAMPATAVQQSQSPLFRPETGIALRINSAHTLVAGFAERSP